MSDMNLEPGSAEFISELHVDAEQWTSARELTDRSYHLEAAQNALIVANEVNAGYLPGINILNVCDFFVNKGELVGIIGPNGAGKSTLLKALFGLVRISSGEVIFDGDDITNLRSDKLVRRGLGFVPQTNNVFPSLTVEENLQMGAYLSPKTFTKRFDYVAFLFPKLAERRKQRAGALSGGERQMLAMSRALMMEPSVLLLDEPSAGLSPALQDEVFVHVKEINRAGVTVIMVEQNARRCLQIVDRGYVLDQGRNAYTATGRELIHDPRVVELYLGTLGNAHRQQQADERRAAAGGAGAKSPDTAGAGATGTGATSATERTSAPRAASGDEPGDDRPEQ